MSVATSTGTLGLDLDPGQIDAVFTDAAPLRVLAGAGAGKTRVLTRRVARRVLDGSIDGDHTLVLTFTRKAAGELRDRLVGLGAGDGVTTGTFHAVAYAQLRRRWLDRGRTVPAIASQPQRILDVVLAKQRCERSVRARELSVEIAWAKSNRLNPESYEDGVRDHRRRPPIAAAQVAKLFAAYEAEKRKRHVVDYDDLLLDMTEALETDSAFAAGQRWKFRHFFVDEFQDLNRAQFDLLTAWLAGRDDLFVVGDPNQAIYGWNGADASYLTEIERHFPHIETVRLDVNYRSTNQVQHAASAVLPDAPFQVLSNGVSAQSGSTASFDGVAPTVRRYVDERAEAVGIARSVRRAHGNGHGWSDIAVLVRTNAQRTMIETALSEHGVPFRSGGGANWLYRESVRSGLEMLRSSPGARLSQCVPDIEQLRVELSGVEQTAIEELARSIRQCLSTDGDMTAGEFIAWLEVASRQDAPTGPRSRPAVVVTTFHRAKGLEWPVVFLAGIEAGLVPYGTVEGAAAQEHGNRATNGEHGNRATNEEHGNRATNEEHGNRATNEEERRLFYVAITRAREEVHCSWAAERTTRTGVAERSPSPWLADVERSAKASCVTPMTPDSVRSLIDEARKKLSPDTQ